ncbi:hypothetical protein D3C87_1941950 [compost metagenome]
MIWVLFTEYTLMLRISSSEVALSSGYFSTTFCIMAELRMISLYVSIRRILLFIAPVSMISTPESFAKV